MRIEDMPHYVGKRTIEAPWSVRDVAEYLGISERRVYEIREMGEIRSTSHGGKIFFDPSEIRRYDGVLNSTGITVPGT